MKTSKSSKDIDRENFQLAGILISVFILAVAIGCCLNKEPDVGYHTSKTSNSIPTDLKICIDTNDPIDWRTNK